MMRSSDFRNRVDRRMLRLFAAKSACKIVDLWTELLLIVRKASPLAWRVRFLEERNKFCNWSGYLQIFTKIVNSLLMMMMMMKFSLSLSHPHSLFTLFPETNCVPKIKIVETRTVLNSITAWKQHHLMLNRFSSTNTATSPVIAVESASRMAFYNRH